MEATASELRRRLLSLPAYKSADWLDGLESRKREEAEFHDQDRVEHKDEQIDSTPNRRFYDSSGPVVAYVDDWFSREIPGRVFLDYACGNGRTTIRAANAGAELAVGIDISPVSVDNAAKNSVCAGTGTRTVFLQRDCEDTELPDSSFDRVLCSGMLHHVDLSRAFPELRRLAKPGARILCVEALSHNPLIQLYREMTPQYRTEWEKNHILGMPQVRYARQWFGVENLRFFCLASPLAGFAPRAIRPAILPGLHALDALLTRIPGVQLWSWQFAFELTVPAKN